MDGHHFDDWARAFAASGTRRRLVGGLAAAALSLLGLDRAAAVACRTPGEVCREDANCCSGLCARDAFGRRRCRCQSPTDCPPTRNPCLAVTCADGACVDGEPLPDYTVCPSGACISGACQQPLACTGAACEADEDVDPQGTCCAGAQCEDTCCIPFPNIADIPNPAPCVVDAECCQNFYQGITCNAGSCCGALGVGCDADDECCSRACDLNQRVCVTCYGEGVPCAGGPSADCCPGFVCDLGRSNTCIVGA